MSGLAVTVATAALPYVVNGVANWVSAAVKTYAPPAVADVTIKGAEASGSKLFGGSGVLGRIGGAAGKAFGWVAAPMVAQSAPVQSSILMSSEVLGSVAGSLIQVGGSYLLNRSKGSQPNETPVLQQMLLAQQLQAQQLHAQWESQMRGQMQGSQLDVKQMLEFAQLVQAKNDNMSLKDLEEFLKHQDGKIDVGQLLQMIQLVKGLQEPKK